MSFPTTPHDTCCHTFQLYIFQVLSIHWETHINMTEPPGGGGRGRKDQPNTMNFTKPPIQCQTHEQETNLDLLDVYILKKGL